MAGDVIVESYVNELELLLNDSSLNSSRRCKNIIESLSSLFDLEHTNTELDLAFKVIFNSDKSLLNFIEKGAVIPTLKSGVKDALSLVSTLFAKYRDQLFKYMVKIKSTCYRCLYESHVAEIKVQAYNIIKDVVSCGARLPVGDDLKIASLLTFILSRELPKKKALSPTVLGKAYELIGVLAEHYPAICNDRIASIIRNILSELKTQMTTTSGVKFTVITGCMLALKGILVNFTQDEEEAPEQAKEIYFYVKKACELHDLNRRVFQRAALQLLETHIVQLWRLVLQDFRFWLRELAGWARRPTLEDKRQGCRTMLAFHKQAWEHLVKSDTDSRDNTNVSEFMKVLLSTYKDTFTNPKATSHELRLAVEGFGALAGLTGHLIQDKEAVAFMFQVIVQRANSDFVREGSSEAEDNSYHLAIYVETLAHICGRLPEVTNDQLVALQRLVQLMLDRYPYLLATTQTRFVAALCNTVINVSRCPAQLFDQFLYPVVYQGLILTCGQTLVEDADLQREVTGQNVITYQDYLPLWKGIFRVGYESRTTPGVTPELRKTITDKLYECLIRALTEFLDKLDVGYKKQDTEEMEIKNDPESSLKGTKPKDHNILCNLANLYKDLFKSLDVQRLTRWLPDLIAAVINRSVNLPLVSAFYKLLATILNVADRTDYFQDEAEEVQSLARYVVKYIEGVMAHCKQYKNDLQASCLLAVISVPVQLIKSLLAGIPSVVQMIFQLGQSYLPLAISGLDAMEQWQTRLSSEQLKPIFKETLPLFDPYLRSRGITLEETDKELPWFKRQERKLKRVTEATTLSQLQQRMLRLLSRLDATTCLSMLRQPKQLGVVAWTSEPTLTLQLPFPDQRITVCLDRLLPRVVELALTSSDRQTKTSACEVLHVCVILLLGSSINDENLSSVFRRLMPALLRLACGSDLVAKQLFHLLVMQLMHWVSSRRMLSSLLSEAVLQAVWDGLTDESDTAVQDLSAQCLHEFVTWSIKQSSEEEQANHPTNIKAIVRQINTYCKHPSLSKRIGAALAFNHLGKLLREHTTLVDRFWLELFYHMVVNLTLPGDSHNHPASLALDHLLKVIQKNADLFNKVSSERRTPAALGSGTLRDLLRWLLLQCGSKSTACAVKCRQLVESLTHLVPDLSGLSDLAAGEDMVRVCEGGGAVDKQKWQLPIQPASSDAERLLASLDCYVWCLSRGLVAPTVLTRTPSRVVACTEYFLNVVNLTAPAPALRTREDSALTQAKCAVVVALFDMLGLLDAAVNSLPSTLWNQRFWKLVALCVFSPDAVGFDWRNHELSRLLKVKLRTLLCTLRDQLTSLEGLYSELSLLANMNCSQIIDDRLVPMCLAHFRPQLSDWQYISGIKVLHKTNLLQHIQHGNSWNGNILVRAIFTSFFDSNDVAVLPEPCVIHYARKIFKFAANAGAEVKETLACVLDQRSAQNQHDTTLTRGQHCLNLMKNAVISHLMSSPREAVQRLLHTPRAVSTHLTLLLLQACKYSKTKRSSLAVGKELVTSVVAAWPQLAAWTGENNSRRVQLVELLQAMVSILPPAQFVGCLVDYDVLRMWLFSQITDKAIRLEYKECLINMVPCVVSQGKTDLELENMLSFLQQFFPASCSELHIGSVERSTFVAVYKAILRTLEVTGDLVVLRAVSNAAADKDHACAEVIAATLTRLMKRHPQEGQVKVLNEIFNRFLSEAHDEDTRLRLLEGFLVPLLCDACKPAVVTFFTDNIQFVIDTFEDKLRLHENDRKSKQQLVRFIGAAQLAECLFGRLEQEEYDKTSNPVGRSAKLPKGDTLAKNLVGNFNRMKKYVECSVDSLKTLFRKLQCCMYKALVTFMCNVNKEEKFFVTFLLKEDSQKIWCKLVPTHPKCTFPIEFDDFPKMKKQLVQIRSMFRPSAATPDEGTVMYLPSQSIFNSSLEDDITRYDFSFYNMMDRDNANKYREENSRAILGLELEEDILNSNECMAPLCAMVKHLSEAFPLVEQAQGPQLPKWMESLRASLTASDQPDNCRAFIVRLIINCQSYFRPLARFWLGPVMQCVIDKCLGEGISFLIHDIVRMMYQWHAVALPNNTYQEKLLASEFLRLLVVNTPNQRNAVFNYNVEVVKCVVTMWKEFVSVPYQELLDFVASSPADSNSILSGLSIADVFLTSNLLPFNETGKSSYYKHLLTHLESQNRQILKSCAAVIGKTLKLVCEKGTLILSDADQEFFNQVVESVSLKDFVRNIAEKNKNMEKFITCVHQIQSSYSPMAKSVVVQCISNLSLPATCRVKLLETLVTALDFDFRYEAFSMLHSQLPTQVMDSNNPDGQAVTLKFINKLLPSLTPAQMSELLPCVISSCKHKKSDCRAVVYEIASWIYDNYKDLNDDRAQSQMKETRAVLIEGLADPDKELQSKNIKFWTINNRLSDDVCGRFVDILNGLYSPASEDSFLSSAVTLLLQTCEKSNEFTQNIFPQPLSECEFQKYSVSGSWRTQHAAFVPMFAETFASQMSSASFGSFVDTSFRLRATQTQSSLYSSSIIIPMSINNEEQQSVYSFGGPSTSSSFGHSYKQGIGFGSDRLGNDEITDGDESSHEGLKRKRFLTNQEQLSDKMKAQNIAKGVRVEKLHAERMKRREGDVKLTRNYRIGDLPDIQIPYHDVINSLQALAKADRLVARQLLVCVHQGLEEAKRAVPGLETALLRILRTSTQHEPTFTATVLELSIATRSHSLIPSSLITDVCKNSNQFSLGALLLEAKLMDVPDVPPPTKRARCNINTTNHEDWMSLAEIYHSMEEKDVVQGLFEEKVAEACAADVRSALQAEGQNNWKRAQQLYCQSIEQSRGSAAEHFLYEAYFKCCAHLSQWRELNVSLKSEELDNNLDDVWADNWSKDHLLPWLFLSEVHCSQETSVLTLAADFDSALSRWMTDINQANHIKSRLGELLSVAQILKGETERSKLSCERSVRQFLESWQQLDPLSHHLRASHLLRLQSLMDILSFVSLPNPASNDWSKQMDAMLSQWQKTDPNASVNMVAWETRAMYRQIFVTKLETQQVLREDHLKKLKLFKVETHLQTVESAQAQNNFHVARKYLSKAKNEKSSSKNRWQLCNSKCLLLRGQLELDPSPDKLERTLLAWKGIETLRERNLTDRSLVLALHEHTADFYSTVLSVVETAPTVVDRLSDRVKSELYQHLSDRVEDVTEELREKVVLALQQALAVADINRLADTYLKMARFCHRLENSNYEDRLIESLLRAMRYGSAEARRLFPCLLKPSLVSHSELFKIESRQVPEWMFLAWVSQLLASLDTEAGSVWAPLLVRMAQAYPIALQFPFHLSCETYKYSQPFTRQIVSELKVMLQLDLVTVTLSRALACVCQPLSCLYYHISRLRLTLSKTDDEFATAYGQMLLEAYPAEPRDMIKGRAFKDVQSFTDQLDKLIDQFQKEKLPKEKFEKKLEELQVLLSNHQKSKEVQEKIKKRKELASFSPWLVEEYEGQVEVPGQYTGESRPLPHQHLTIVGFKRHVRTEVSLRAPIQITFLGNDAKEHPYLVKFGEDLRQDQRIQQLFVLMNHLLRDNVITSSRNISIDTYTVAPLSSRLGIIQWVEHTTQLDNFMLRNKDTTEKVEKAYNIFNTWFENKCNVLNPSKFYKTIKKEESVGIYRKALNAVPPSMLREAVWGLAASLEAFVHLRAAMLTSYACLSACHWLLGIGDRHLRNTLVCLQTGRFLGIDFGHAFGTATQFIKVPELVPIRLTPQILNLAAPMQETGLLKETMVHTLNVMRENSRVLLATMAVFVNEPSVEWLKAARQVNTVENRKDVWYPSEKIAIARRKLEGVHPRTVMEEELSSNLSIEPYLAQLLEILSDDLLLDIPSQGLSTRQQVECLVALATNEHILSKTFKGWWSWM